VPKPRRPASRKRGDGAPKIAKLEAEVEHIVTAIAQGHSRRPEHTIGGDHLTRILDGICSQRGTPAAIRTDNGPEFAGILNSGTIRLPGPHRTSFR
jgi:hypothetical protein